MFKKKKKLGTVNAVNDDTVELYVGLMRSDEPKTKDLKDFFRAVQTTYYCFFCVILSLARPAFFWYGIQRIVTPPKYGHGALNIRRP